MKSLPQSDDTLLIRTGFLRSGGLESAAYGGHDPE
jgi:hypothetical protein